MISFWEKDAFTCYDYIIIGSGIIGLSTAIEIKEAMPASSVLVLERGIFPTGASTRNAGFACFGSLTEVLSDMKRIGEDATLHLIAQRYHGLSLLRQRLGDAAIHYEGYGGYELLFEGDEEAVERISDINDLLHTLAPEGMYVLRNDLIESFGFNRNKVKNLVCAPCEGQIHSGYMMHALARYALDLGVEIITGAEVLSLEEQGSYLEISVRQPVEYARKTGSELHFHAQQAAVCTNAMSSYLLPEISIQPGRGQVLITQPIPELRWKGVFHFDEGFYYFRNVGNRILFGGGRNLAFDAETTNDFSYNEDIQARLEELLREVIVPDVSLTVDQRWAGIMGFSDTKLPVVRKISDRIAIGFGCNGMGVALGSLIGKETAMLLAQLSHTNQEPVRL